VHRTFAFRAPSTPGTTPHGLVEEAIMTVEPERPNDATREAEREEAKRQAGSDRMPTEDEAREAEEHTIDDDVREHEREMAERGAHQKGEGRIP